MTTPEPNPATAAAEEPDYFGSIVANANIGVLIGSPFGHQKVIKHLSQKAAAQAAEIERLKADNDRLNQMLRATGYGQGQIDAYAEQCEKLEAAEAALARLRAALQEITTACPAYGNGLPGINAHALEAYRHCERIAAAAINDFYCEGIIREPGMGKEGGA